MKAEGPVLVERLGSLRFRRLPFVFAVVVAFPLGLAMAIQAGLVDFAVVMILLVPLFIVLALSVNRFGLFANGLAPGQKPLRGLLQEPHVIPWAGIAFIEVLSDERANPSVEAVVKLTKGTEFAIDPEVVAWYLGDPTKVQQYFRLLAHMGPRLKGGLHTLETSDALVQRILSDPMMVPDPALARAGTYALDQWRRYRLESALVLAAGLGSLVVGLFVEFLCSLIGLLAMAIGGWGYVHYARLLRRVERPRFPVAYSPPPSPPPTD